MDEPVNSNQNPQQSSSVTVPVGGAEGAPVAVSVEAPVAVPENSIGVESSEAEPVISEEEERVGVSVVSDKPIIHPDAKTKGLDHSIPDAHKYGSLPIDPQVIKTQQAGSINDSTTWIAYLAEKVNEFKKKITGGEVHPQEVN